jgi:hypothetical protein
MPPESGSFDTVFAVWFVALLAIAILWFVVWWRIFAKCTGHGWLSLLMVIPVIDIVVLIYAAFCPTPEPPDRLSDSIWSPPPADRQWRSSR